MEFLLFFPTKINFKIFCIFSIVWASLAFMPWSCQNLFYFVSTASHLDSWSVEFFVLSRFWNSLKKQEFNFLAQTLLQSGKFDLDQSFLHFSFLSYSNIILPALNNSLIQPTKNNKYFFLIYFSLFFTLIFVKHFFCF
jgi:hypothetical protein